MELESERVYYMEIEKGVKQYFNMFPSLSIKNIFPGITEILVMRIMKILIFIMYELQFSGNKRKKGL